MKLINDKSLQIFCFHSTSLYKHVVVPIHFKKTIAKGTIGCAVYTSHNWSIIHNAGNPSELQNPDFFTYL